MHLQQLLDNVVRDKDAEDPLARQHEMIKSGYVTNQFDRTKGPGGQNSTGGGKFQNQPE